LIHLHHCVPELTFVIESSCKSSHIVTLDRVFSDCRNANPLSLYLGTNAKLFFYTLKLFLEYISILHQKPKHLQGAYPSL